MAHVHRWTENTIASSMMDSGSAYDCGCGAQKHIYIDADGSKTVEILDDESEEN